MNAQQSIANIETLIGELEAFSPNRDNPEFVQWRPMAGTTLRAALGAEHQLLDDFTKVSFLPRVVVRDTARQSKYRHDAFERGRNTALGILRAAIFELGTSGASTHEQSGFDAALWSHVGHLAEDGRWHELASQTAIFFEDRLRAWAGQPAERIGRDLVLSVLKPEGGIFPLGITGSEAQGWQQLGLGFVQAVRNVDLHRIQQREDARIYAIGVVGTASLILTQLRHQHGNSFRSI
ncbi:MAG: hypothetical protein O3C10_05795 [Chloroflexi bacterium]|nr:hypothetical protein [Chloroflexota bacterium]